MFIFIKYSIELVLITFILSFAKCSAGELADYFEFVGGYDVVKSEQYSVIVDGSFSLLENGSKAFRGAYYDIPGVSPVITKFVDYYSSGYELSIYKPSLSALLISKVDLNIKGIDYIDTSLDVVIFRSKDGVVEGGVLLVHGFSKTILGDEFHKEIIVEIDSRFISNSLSRLPPEIMEDYLVK